MKVLRIWEGRAPGRYIFWFYLYKYRFLMFKMYENTYFSWICLCWTCVGCLWLDLLEVCGV
ncbi:hypothetical protein M6B38_387240 [Iris pallida]|uniref:Uncharacterized protein n=1 Tax=Iris pallida TaxID=29817 RepID=A0AAX6G2V4_IRIPA|nr:hypothetical protein M6B38_387240 [Iris pallida]